MFYKNPEEIKKTKMSKGDCEPPTLVSDEKEEPQTRVVGLSERAVGLSERVVGISEKVVGISEKVVGISERVVGISERVVGISERVVGLSERVKRLPKADYLIQDVQLSCSEWGSVTGDRTNLVTVGCIISDPLDDHHTLKYSVSPLSSPLSSPLLTLREFVKTKKIVSLEFIVHILTSSASGLRTLHFNKIRHGSLSPDSILIQDTKVMIDDGIEHFCRLTHAKRTSDTPLLLNHGYFSPEEFFVSKPRSFATDMYAFGSLMYFLLSDGEDPWSEESVFSVQRKVITEKLTPLVHKTLSLVPMPQTLFRLMVQCFSFDPEHRPSASVAFSLLSSLSLTISATDLDYISGEVESNKTKALCLEETQRAEYYNKMRSLNTESNWWETIKRCFHSALSSCFNPS